jgi:hypothetical protein
VGVVGAHAASLRHGDQGRRGNGLFEVLTGRRLEALIQVVVTVAPENRNEYKPPAI